MSVFRSIRFRLTLWYVGLLALVLAAFCAVLYLALRERLYAGLDDSLETRVEFVDALISTGAGAPVVRGAEIPGDPLEGEQFVRIYDPAGEITFDNTTEDFPIPLDAASIRSAAAGDANHRTVEVDWAKLRVLSAPVVRDSQVAGVVEAGIEDDVQETLDILLIIIVLAYPLTLLVAGSVGLLIAGRALSPIDHITRTAEEIGAEDLSRRIDFQGPDDEVGRLARTFDDMIARLDAAFQRQRQFTADASHELRTPLTSIKLQTEIALQRDRDPAEYREVLIAVNAEVDRMTRLIENLLTLARADAAQIPLTRGIVDVGALVNSAADHVRPVALAGGISLGVEAGPTVSIVGDDDLLLQMLLNLLDNAVKYTPAGGAITAGWRAVDGSVEIFVSDTGAGIAPEHLPHVFDRFYRADPSRSRTAGGAGLGLSIARWIAEAHGGSMTAESVPGEGSTFTARLPLS